MSELVLTLSTKQAAHYIRSYSYDILHGHTSDPFIINNVRDFISSIKDSQTIINILYELLIDYADELAKLSNEDKNSSLYYNLSDFIHFHHIFSTLNSKYKKKFNLKRMLLKVSDIAYIEFNNGASNKNVLDWLEFYNV